MTEEQPKVKFKITNKFITSIWKLITFKTFNGDVEEQLSTFMRLSLGINLIILLLLLPIDGAKKYAVDWLANWVMEEYSITQPQGQNNIDSPIVGSPNTVESRKVEIPKPQVVIPQIKPESRISVLSEEEVFPMGKKVFLDTIAYKIKKDPESKQQMLDILGIKEKDLDSFLK